MFEVLRIGKAAKFLGVSNSTLLRAEKLELISFERGSRSTRRIRREILIHAPVLSQRITARRLGMKGRDFRLMLEEIERRLSPPEYGDIRRIRYFSYSAVKVLKRGEAALGALRMGYRITNLRYRHTFVEVLYWDRLRVDYDGVSNE